MKITWLGQAGLLMETEHCRVMVAPYLSSGVEKINPKNYRRVPVDPAFLACQPDILLLTHDHLDHLDPETLAHYLSKDSPPSLFLRLNGHGRRPLTRRQSTPQNLRSCWARS